MTESNPPPLTPSAFQVLLALAGGKAHGYGIMGFVNEVTGGSVQLGPGTLCRTLARLAADGLVEEVPDAREDESHDAQRRYYRLSRQGRQVATREAELLERLVFAATDVGLLTRRAETA